MQIEIYWPRLQCRLLKDDVVILDSPGLDYDSDFDSWINSTTRDAGEQTSPCGKNTDGAGEGPGRGHVGCLPSPRPALPAESTVPWSGLQMSLYWL